MYRISGIFLISGALHTTVFNMFFPRAEDPFDTIIVLNMMNDNVMLRQISFIVITFGIWVMTIGLIGVYKINNLRTPDIWICIGVYVVLAGAVILTIATGLGMTATVAAIEWANAGSTTTSIEFAKASALNAADDGVWFMSIITFWSGLGDFGDRYDSGKNLSPMVGLDDNYPWICDRNLYGSTIYIRHTTIRIVLFVCHLCTTLIGVGVYNRDLFITERKRIEKKYLVDKWRNRMLIIKTWMRIVGGFYLLTGIFTIHLI